MNDRPVTFELVLDHLRKQTFAVLSTTDEEGKPYSAGVNYGVSERGSAISIFVMTRRHLKKARNVAQNSRVSLVVPLTRRLLWFLPPATLQLSGQATILDWSDDEGRNTFRKFWIGRRILKAYEESYGNGETRICFLKITPDPVINTYMVDSNIWQLRNHMESGAAQVIRPRGNP
ncbi:hypothetical protein HLY00_4269 [Mycolicibacterium hippocampi]|uniref:Pyridoxamine 5'-phosphate oxidase N-terminal domain-containing protein n=1 Tax=Mycolicibacterium hippocampi TaxID=659824 RepID=A0A850PQ27_9MYCO|nr:pyridoxamine 5'-phosphate oxidase family protein [Mycolicibacterium hippocampi]NVN52562.1 hypothetical protein [Mycolicibacterium hippocampi]